SEPIRERSEAIVDSARHIIGPAVACRRQASLPGRLAGAEVKSPPESPQDHRSSENSEACRWMNRARFSSRKASFALASKQVLMPCFGCLVVSGFWGSRRSDF